jgi:hypothetical protein
MKPYYLLVLIIALNISFIQLRDFKVYENNEEIQDHEFFNSDNFEKPNELLKVKGRNLNSKDYIDQKDLKYFTESLQNNDQKPSNFDFKKKQPVNTGLNLEDMNIFANILDPKTNGLDSQKQRPVTGLEPEDIIKFANILGIKDEKTNGPNKKKLPVTTGLDKEDINQFAEILRKDEKTNRPDLKKPSFTTGLNIEKDRKKIYADLNKLPKVTDYDAKYLKIETENSERSERKDKRSKYLETNKVISEFDAKYLRIMSEIAERKAKRKNYADTHKSPHTTGMDPNYLNLFADAKERKDNRTNYLVLKNE